MVAPLLVTAVQLAMATVVQLATAVQLALDTVVQLALAIVVLEGREAVLALHSALHLPPSAQSLDTASVLLIGKEVLGVDQELVVEGGEG